MCVYVQECTTFDSWGGGGGGGGANFLNLLKIHKTHTSAYERKAKLLISSSKSPRFLSMQNDHRNDFAATPQSDVVGIWSCDLGGRAEVFPRSRA